MGRSTREATMVDDIAVDTELSPWGACTVAEFARSDLMVKPGNVGLDVRSDTTPKRHQRQQHLMG